MPLGGLMRIATLFLGYVLLEIAGFVIVGRWIGVLGVLLAVLATGVAGVAVLRGAAVGDVMALRRRAGPAAFMADLTLLALGAVLLILPGLLGDVVGLLLMVSGVRRAVARLIGAQLRQRGAATVTVIDGSYEVVERPEHDPGRPPSDWRGH